MEHLLLLHGAIGSKQQLEELEKELSNSYTVHTLNFSGHGNTIMPNEFSIPLFANDVINYLNEQQIKDAHIFGYSMGGYVGLYLAKHNPERVKKVFTLATKFLWTPTIAEKEIKMLQADKIIEKLPAFANTLNERHQPNDWKLVLEKTAIMMIALGNKNELSIDDYKTIEKSILIGIGDSDTMVTLEETIEVYRSIPKANFMVMPNTPHPIEKIDQLRLCQEIKRFFN
ncbi:MAG: alpha/beta hydrolase [Bacteroidia bacterium]|nr:alpha/beta hydrolase [Bacteroidia bacterium]